MDRMDPTDAGLTGAVAVGGLLVATAVAERRGCRATDGVAAVVDGDDEERRD
jgi:hypothetical protein